MKATKKQQKEELAARRDARTAAWVNGVQFVRRATVNINDPDDPGKRQPRWRWQRFICVYTAEAPPDVAWMTAEALAETPKAERRQQYIIATNGTSIHAALIPQGHADWLLPNPYNPNDLDVGPVIDRAAAEVQEGKRITINVLPDTLRNAIHPDAANIQLTVGEQGQPIEVFSFLADGTQIGYAMIMPNVMPLVGQRPELPARERKTEKGD